MQPSAPVTRNRSARALMRGPLPFGPASGASASTTHRARAERFDARVTRNDGLERG